MSGRHAERHAPGCDRRAGVCLRSVTYWMCRMSSDGAGSVLDAISVTPLFCRWEQCVERSASTSSGRRSAGQAGSAPHWGRPRCRLAVPKIDESVRDFHGRVISRSPRPLWPAGRRGPFRVSHEVHCPDVDSSRTLTRPTPPRGHLWKSPKTSAWARRSSSSGSREG
ncbi:hypothetical protein SMALA_5003 [Streptomyces malaysiensis subsp. malaysiensis]|nr:hypothetical protein SMALA_5003 [Streptomyces malaysiensis]